MADKNTPPAQPTPEDMAKMQKVADAGAQAAAQAPDAEQATQDAKQAMKEERDRQQLPMSDAELEQIADLFVNKTIAQMEQRGAFDPAPEPVAPAIPREAPPAPGDPAEPAAAPAPDGEPAPAPQRTTFAQRFMGVR